MKDSDLRLTKDRNTKGGQSFEGFEPTGHEQDFPHLLLEGHCSPKFNSDFPLTHMSFCNNLTEF